MSYYDDIKKAAYEEVVNCHKYNAVLKVSTSSWQLYGNFSGLEDKDFIKMENIIKYVRDVSNVFVCKHPLDACNFFKTEYDFEKVYTEAQEIYAKLLDFDISVGEYIGIDKLERSLISLICENVISDIENEMNSSFISQVNSTYSTIVTKSKIKTPRRKLKTKWTYENIPDLNQGIIR